MKLTRAPRAPASDEGKEYGKSAKHMTLSKEELKQAIEDNAMKLFGISLQEASANQFYKCVCIAVRDILTERRHEFKQQMSKQQSKQVYYMSMEFFHGR